MPEGNTVRFFKDELQKFIGKTIISASGKTKKINTKKLINQKIIDVFKIGKVLYIKLSSGSILQLHFLLFGSFQLNPTNKIQRQLILKVGNDELVFNTSSIKLINESEIKLDIQLDPTYTKYSKSKSKRVFKQYIHDHPNEIIADALMNQDIFPGVGNIIKNESLYLAKINPNRKLSSFSESEINKILESIRNFSLKFYRMDKTGNYIFNVYDKDVCPNGEKIVKKEIGKLKRISMWCPKIQK